MSIARYTIAVNDTGTATFTTAPINGCLRAIDWDLVSAGDTGARMQIYQQRVDDDTGSRRLVYTDNTISASDSYIDTGLNGRKESLVWMSSEKIHVIFDQMASYDTGATNFTPTVGRLYLYVDEDGR
jgi:hypothetical protein